MKLTKSRLQQIIAEEFALKEEELPAAFAKGPEGGEGGEGGEPEEKLKSDVEKIRKYIEPLLPNIDDPIKYAQLLKMILIHPVKHKNKAHRKLKKLFIAGLEGK